MGLMLNIDLVQLAGGKSHITTIECKYIVR